jgi:DNA polymerase
VARHRTRELVRPGTIVALGTTAARRLFGGPVAIAKSRGKPDALAGGTRVFVTIHPSLLLRLRTGAGKEAEYRRFVDDLKTAAAKTTAVARSAGAIALSLNRQRLPRTG